MPLSLTRFLWRMGRRRGLAQRVLSLALIVTLLLPGGALAAPPANRAAMLAPATWSDFLPNAPVKTHSPTCAINVSDPQGLQAATAQYQISTDGGGSWTDWGNAGLSAYGSVTTTLSIAVNGAVFVESLTANQIRFRIQDNNSQQQTSPAYTVPLDYAAPAAPQGLAAQPATWTAANDFSLTWTNPPDPAGIGAAYYRLDTPPASDTDGTRVADNDIAILLHIPVSGQGQHTVYVWLEDTLGNLDHANRAEASLFYETTPPSAPTFITSTSHIPQVWATNNVITATWSGAGDDRSGIAGYAVLWDQSPATIPTPVTTTVELTAASPALGESNAHYVHVRALDGAGNWSAGAAHLGPFYIDRSSPPAPLGLLADPDVWTRQNQFTLFWALPADVSGIAGAYYKLDSAPTEPADGTWVAGDSLTMIANLTVGGDGAHTAYVWLKDKLGNVDHTHIATTTLRYDGSSPQAPVGLTPTPAGWTNLNLFSLNWTNPVEPSGIVGAYYRLDSAPAGPTDGTYVAGANIQALSNLTVAGAGAHPVYVWLKNGADGVDQTLVATTTLRYDNVAPTPSAVFTSTTHIIRSWSNSNLVGVNWSAATDGLSGVAGYALLWDQSPTTLPAAVTTTVGLTATSPALADGSGHYAHLRTRDNAGNWTATALHLGPFYVDSQAPAAPAALTASPSSWTNQNLFSVSWTNPTEASGVAGAYYKLDAAPTGPADGTWTAGDNLTGIAGISVSGNGAHTIYVWLKDKAGNADHTRVATTTLYYNNTGLGAPQGLTVAPASWNSVNAFVLNWTNPDPGPAGIAGAYYKLDSAPTTPTDGIYVAGVNLQSISGVSVSGDGAHPVYVWLRDGAGNVDHNNRAASALFYDGTPPALPTVFTSTTHIAGAWTTQPDIAVNWSAATDGLSGVAGYALSWDASPTTLPAAVTTTLGLTGAFSAVSDGAYYAHLRARDVAGSWTTTALHLGPFGIDRQAPGAPTALAATPAGWTNVNQFNLAWANPADLAGIAGAYYKLDSAPTGSADGTWVAGEGRTSLTGVSVSGDGAHTIYVWLQDKAGNADYTRFATTTLRYNGSAPAAPLNLTPAPAGWTNANNFGVSWTNPTGGLSPIAGAYYKLDMPPASPTDGTFVAGANLSSLSGLSVGGDGDHALHVWLKDDVGNVDAANRASTSLRYDSMPPTSPNTFTSTTHYVGAWSNIPQVSVRWAGALDLRSGVHGYGLLWDSNPNTLPPAITTTLNLTDTSPTLIDGSYYAHLRTRDVAGNWTLSALHLGPFMIDRQAPGAPANVAITPTTWTNTNAFTVTWTNPADLSGIGGAYYKFDGAPLSPFDGVFVSGENLAALNSVAAPGNGVHTLYLWLRDRAGNIDQSRYVTTTLYYNGLGAGVPIGISATPAGWSPTNAFTVTWTNPLNVAGIAGAYYKLDTVPGAPTDGVYVAGANLQTLAGLTVSGDGVHPIYVWLKDNAGNVDHNNRASTTLRYDATAPTLSGVFTSTTHVANVWSNVGTIQAGWGAATETQSGLAGYALVWDSASATTPAAVTTTLGLTTTFTPPADGAGYYAHLRAGDLAGNWTATRHLGPFLVDTHAPAAPLSLTADPTGWTNQNQFILFWINPEELSGVAGAYYKLDAAPTGNFDGTWAPGDGRSMLTNLTVAGDGAHTAYVWLRDKAGNVDYTRFATASLQYNGTPPAAPNNLLATPGTWSNANSFNLTWTNPVNAAGIVGAYYKLDSAPAGPTDGTYIASANIQNIFNLKVAGEGSHVIYLWLRDAAGNVDHTRRASVFVRYDSVAPSLPATMISTSHFTATWSNDATVDARWTEASDANSGVAGYALAWDQSPTTLPAAVTTTVNLTDTSPTLVEGNGHYAHLRVRDVAGNWTATALHLGPFYIDLQAPAAPVGLTTTPAGWSNTNQFTLNWTNPADLSGVAGAYYKLDAAPTGNFDGVFVSGDSLSSIANITVGSDGAHTAYVWLRDKAGNLDYARFATASLLYNGVGPGAPQGLTAAPAGWTNVNSFNLSWTNPANAAGIVGAYYKLDTPPTSPTDGALVSSPNIQNIFNLKVAGDGPHAVYVWLRDAAGNVDHTRRASVFVRYDSVAPNLPATMISTSHFTATWSNDATVDARWTEAGDANSGVAGYALAWDQSPTTLPAAVTTTVNLTDTSPTLVEGNGHYAHLRVRDVAGNWTATALHLGPFYIDLQAPAAPIALAATPAGWTNINQFTLNWTNPADTAGIAGAYYKLDAAPSSPFDGVFVSGDNLTTLINITVFGNGAHTVYVWLRDKAGNLDHTRFATTTLFYNATGPNAPQALTATPAGWTNVNSFNLSWTNPSSPATIVGAYYKLDTPPTFPTDGSLVSSPNIQNIFNLHVSGDGAHSVYVWLKDAAGNLDHAQRAATFLRYDTTPPNLPTVFTSTSHITATWSNDPTADALWAGATDAGSGVGGYAILWDQNPTTLPPAITSTVGLTATSPALGEGVSHYAHLRARDNLDAWTAGAVHLGPFYIDLTAPAAPLALRASPPGWSNHSPFTVLWNNPTDASGIGGAYFKLDAAPGNNFDGVFVSGDNLTTLNNVPVATDGAHVLYVWLKDRAGNLDYTHWATTTLYMDTVPPGAPSFLTPDPAGWSNAASFGLSWTNPVEPAGIAGAYYKLDNPPAGNADGTFVATDHEIAGIALPGEGMHRIYLWLRDNAGNADYRTRNSEVFYSDRTAPTTTLSITGTLGLNGWYTSTVSGGFAAQDALSGVNETRHRINAGAWQTGATFVLSAGGVYTVEYSTLDVAGNREITRTQPIKIDLQPPSTTLTRQGTLGQEGWYTSPVQITLTPADAISGPGVTRYRVDAGAWMTGTIFTLNTDGAHQIEYMSRDAAGNQEAVKTDSVRVDIQGPTTSYMVAGALGEAGWFLSPVTMTLTPSDTTSGAVGTFYRVDAGGWTAGTSFVVAGETSHSVRFYSTDRAGNSGVVQLLNINIDATAPLPPFNLIANPYQRWSSTNAFTMTWTSLPDVSGIAGAYYKVNSEPASKADGTYAPGAINSLTNLTVPGEGKHTVYLWLRDAAGNANHLTRNVLSEALWLDTTAPTTTHVLSGSLGLNGWYTSSVRVTLSGQDALSGYAGSYYRLDDQTWVAGTTALIATSDRHALQYYSLDNAGNAESPNSAFVRVDVDAPAAPLGLRAGPEGWQRVNNFTATWTDPVDTSGISAAYYKVGSAPTSPSDGVRVNGPLGTISGIQAPREGKHALYVWLVDAAGNMDYRRTGSVPDGFWYDAQPPTTTLTISGTPGIGGWYRSAVNVSLNAADSASGAAATYYRVNAGTWKTGVALALGADGSHVVEYYSVDQAGNREATRTATVKIDTQSPTSHVSEPLGYQESDVVTVRWSGTDAGSGVLYYDVEYKDGAGGAWTAWRTATDETSGLFVGQRGHVYYLRSRARDRAGNVEQIPPDAGHVKFTIEPVANGRFETRDLLHWNQGGVLGKRVESGDAHGGGTSYLAVLGNPELGPCYDTAPATLLEGAAVISQTIYVPATPDTVAPKLHFWYHVITYDVVWSTRYNRYYDSFDVELSVSGAPTRTLLLRDGNYDPANVGAGKPATDLGWRQGNVDLSAYAGRTVTLYFSVHNRVDRFFNTWAFLDDVSITGSGPAYKLFLPNVPKQQEGRFAGAESVADEGGPPPPR